MTSLGGSPQQPQPKEKIALPPINEQTTLWALENYVSQNEYDRKLAEKILTHNDATPQFPTFLFNIAMSEQLNENLRLQAAINLKNIIMRSWQPLVWELWKNNADSIKNKKKKKRKAKTSPTAPIVSDVDKENLKKAIVKGIIVAPVLIRKQFTCAFERMVKHDYPKNWPEMFPTIKELISSNEGTMVHAGLFLLMFIVKQYETLCSDNDERWPLYQILEEIFPIVLLRLQQLATSPRTIEVYHAEAIICRIYFMANAYDMHESQMKENVFGAWMEQFIRIWLQPVPGDEPKDTEKRIKWGPWNSKKYAIHLFSRFMSQYRLPAQTDQSADQSDEELDPSFHEIKKSDHFLQKINEFHHLFMGKFARPITQAVLELMGLIAKNVSLPSVICQFCFQFLSEAIKPSAIYQFVKPHISILVNEIVFPLLCMSEEDLVLFFQYPDEYVRNEYDDVERQFSSKKWADYFLDTLFTERNKEHIMSFLQFLTSQVLIPYLQTDGKNRDYRKKEGALLALSIISTKLKRMKEIPEKEKQNLLEIHVIPELYSELPWMRARAVQCFTYYADVGIEKGDERGAEIYRKAVSRSLELLADRHLPVKCQAGIGLSLLLRQKEVKKIVAPHVTYLLQLLLNVLSEVDNELLVNSLKVLISHNPAQIIDIALPLTNKLVETFLEKTEDLADDAAVSTAMEIVHSLLTLVRVINDVSVAQQIEQLTIPLIKRGFSDECSMEFFGEMCQIVTHLIYKTKSVSPQMWEFFVVFKDMFEDFAYDSFKPMESMIEQYVKYGADVFIDNKTNVMNICINYYRHIMSDEDLPESMTSLSIDLMETVMLECRNVELSKKYTQTHDVAIVLENDASNIGRSDIDIYLPQIIEVSVNRLRNIQPVAELFTIRVLEIVTNSIYCNPHISLQALQQLNYVDEFFKKLANEIEYFSERYHDMRSLVLGVANILLVDKQNLPKILQEGLPQLLHKIIDMLIDDEKVMYEDIVSKGENEEQRMVTYAENDQIAIAMGIRVSDDKEDLFADEDEEEDDDDENGDENEGDAEQEDLDDEGEDDDSSSEKRDNEDIVDSGDELDIEGYENFQARELQFLDSAGKFTLPEDYMLDGPLERIDHILFLINRIQQLHSRDNAFFNYLFGGFADTVQSLISLGPKHSEIRFKRLQNFGSKK